ncbi:pyruvate formate lyase family protein [Escherichia coli]
MLDAVSLGTSCASPSWHAKCRRQRSWKCGTVTNCSAMRKTGEVIADQPPKTFWQALQLCYFIQLILQIESNGHSVSFARMDQYLYPFYRRDVELEQSLAVNRPLSCCIAAG